MGKLVRRNTVSLIRHGEFHSTSRGRPVVVGSRFDNSGEFNVAAVGRIPGGIAEQVHENLGKASRVGVQCDRFGRTLHGQSMPARLHHWLHGVDGIPHDISQLACSHLDFHLAVPDSRYVQKVINQSLEPAYLPLRYLERARRR